MKRNVFIPLSLSARPICSTSVAGAVRPKIPYQTMSTIARLSLATTPLMIRLRTMAKWFARRMVFVGDVFMRGLYSSCQIAG